MVLGQAHEALQNRIASLTGLIGYWRDDAAHGQATRLSDVEAFTALAMLLRLAALVNDHWAELVHRS
jgi:hypothetical protein